MNHVNLVSRVMRQLLMLTFRANSERYLVPAFSILVAILVSGAASAQVSGPNARTASGVPFNSYTLDNLESVNYFNGRMHFGVPLINVSGRGSAGQNVMLTIDPQYPSEGKGCPNCPNYYQLSAAIWNYEVGYGPGVLEAVVEGRDALVQCQSNVSDFNNATRTFLRFKTSDGTEYSLFDALHDGQVMPNSDGCSTDQRAALRGKVFVTKDGSEATFVSDADIYDNRYGSGPQARYFPSGVLKLRDGTRYRIDNGVVSWSSDRNGNKMAFEYYPSVAPIFPLPNNSFPGRVKKITDSLAREVQFSYDNPTGVATERYDEITYKGFAGQPRTIRVYYARLEHVLRSPSETIQTYCQLGVDCETPNGGQMANPLVVSSVVLPDNRSFHFYYNRYAELARYELPTGGAVEYDYDWGLHQSVFASDTYRRVVQRRTYPTGATDSSFESKTTYSKPEHSYQQPAAGSYYYAGATTGYVEVDHIGKSNGVETLLSRERHFYYGMAGAPAVSSNVPGAVWWSTSAPPVHSESSSYLYQSWQDGHEYKTEYLSSDGVSPLRRVEFNWQQSANPSWWVISPDLAPDNNPRIVETVTTLVDTNQVSKKSSINPNDSNDKGFDQYNNRTDLWEYDYGDGVPGALLRHTHTSFITAPNYADAENGPNLISLPSQTSVYDGTGIERARTTYEYDNYTQDGTYHAGLLPRSLISGLCDGTAQNCLGQPNFTDPNYTTRGNATGATHYLLDANGSVTGSAVAYAQYDIAGNIIKTIDPRGYAMTVDYSDNFGAPDGEARLNTAPTQLASQSQSSYAFPTLVTNALGQTAYSQFDYYIGQIVNSEDANGIVSSISYNDPLDRPKQSIHAVNGGADVNSQTTISYDDLNHLVTTKSDQNNYLDNLLRREAVYDGFGRTIETRQYETATSYIATRQTYDALGRKSQISNPFRTGETIQWTTTAYDDLSRVISVTTPDNAVLKTAYSGNRILMADQNESDQLRRKRITRSDALGRMKDVWEVTSPDGATESISFPNWSDVTAGYHASYEYDTLDNLTRVSQGNQTRNFSYDSLKRLIFASNPESGTINYQYDENGNLKVKTDARGASTHFSYDALSRITRRWYNGSSSLSDETNNIPALPAGVTTPDEVAYFYDSQSLPSAAPNFSRGYATGRLVAVTYGAGGSAGNYYGYDAAGRELVKFQQTSGVNYQVRAVYNLADAITSLIYPTGDRVDYGFDRAGRTSSMTGTLGDGRSRNYATNIAYSPFGGLAQEQFGTQTALYHKLHYNTRGQLYDVGVSTQSVQADEFNWNRGRLEFFYGGYAWGQSGPANNGNITSSQHWIPANDAITDYSYTQDNYSYDSLNRIASTSEVHGKPNWVSGQDYVQSFDYDRWGNRTINPSSAGVNNIQFDKSDAQNTNRLYAPGDTSLPINQRRMQYDSAGNLTQDSYTGQGTRLYDAENRMTGAQDLNQSWSYYTYDGEGRRVRRNIDGVETRQIYGMDGELLLEVASNTLPPWMPKEYGYRNGQLLIIATAQSNIGSNRPSKPINDIEKGETTAGAQATDFQQNLLARNNNGYLPEWLTDRISGKTNSAISDTSTPLYGPSFPYASLGGNVPPLLPQSTFSKIVFASNREGSAQLYTMYSDGSGVSRLTNDAANDEAPKWSPDNARIVFQSDRDNVFSGMADIYVMNYDGSGQTRLTSDPNDDSAPVWSPDGSKIAFQSARNGANYQIYVMNADGSGQLNVSNSAANDTQPSWSPDGTKIAFASDRDQPGFPSIYVMNANGSGQTRLTSSGTGFRDEQPAWSRDGMKLAFSSTRDSAAVDWQLDTLGQPTLLINKEVYVMNADGSSQVRLTNVTANDDSPSWSGDGTRIHFRSDRNNPCCDAYEQVWTMNADGSNQMNLSNNQFGDYGPNSSGVLVNTPPTVSITTPTNGGSFTAPANITVTANATDSDGSVSRVDFYRGTSLIGTATSAPYTINWNNVTGGSYTLTARATDNLGATTTSNPINITVNAPPTVSITTPVNGASFNAPANITITANATDSDGSISRVDFYQGTTLIGSSTTSPYTITWSHVNAGNYSLTARATDNAGATTTSSPVSVSSVPTGSCSGPSSGLVSCWKFDENGGTTTADSSGYGHDGVLQNGTSWTTGTSGSGLSFDGLTGAVATNGIADVSNNFTVSFWALPTASHEIDSEDTSSTGGTSGERYAIWPTYDGTDAGAGVSVGNNGISVYEHSTNYMPATLVYPTSISNWTHITVVYENKQPKLYVNGTLVRTGLTSPKNNVHLNPASIGGGVYGYYSGRMDEVRVYNRVLGSDEINVLVSSGPPRNGSAFVSQMVPTTMVAGQSYPVSVTMSNTGSNIWTAAGAYNLGSQNPQDNGTWGMARVGLPASAVLGDQVTFNFTVTAPAAPGTYNFQWRMVQDGVEWFGDFSPNVTVTITDPNLVYHLYTADVRWVVTDHLGTPRMIFDASGSLAGVSQHDYLPFGEELFGGPPNQPGVGGRTTTQGYTSSDNVRQKFTSYERDGETGLDFAASRYYSNTQGRFNQADTYSVVLDFQFSGAGRKARSRFDTYLSNPQRWNRYSYALNNPLAYTDSAGFDPVWVHNLTTDMYFSVSEEEYKKNYAGQNGYEQVTNIGPDGLVFQLNQLEWSYANDHEYSKMIGSNVYLGADGRFHAAASETSTNDPPSNSGYLDINLSYGTLYYFLGVTGGVMVRNDGGTSPYIGGGFMTPGPGGAVSYSPDSVSGGMNWQAQVVPGGAYGQDEEGNDFHEFALGPPSASLTTYYVFNAPHPVHIRQHGRNLNDATNRPGAQRQSSGNCACNKH